MPVATLDFSHAWWKVEPKPFSQENSGGNDLGNFSCGTDVALGSPLSLK